jgi:tetratricopeptide (TPR) repeat protein
VQEGFKAANKWERAKEPNLQSYCTLLASGTAKLVNGSPLAKDVPQIADQADKLLPGRAAPSVLKGRALLRLGKATDALAALKEARTRDDRALDDPVALLAWARANARTGHFEEAAAAYRAALPRTSALSAPERSAASFEAGMIVMAQGPKGVDDAVAMLRQARREAQDARVRRRRRRRCSPSAYAPTRSRSSPTRVSSKRSPMPASPTKRTRSSRPRSR